MNYAQMIKSFREKNDCREMDESKSSPLVVFNIFEKVKGQWIKLEGEFYTNKPFEAIDQAIEEINRKAGMLKAVCVRVCNYYVGSDGPHVILELKTIKKIFKGKGLQSINPSSKVFIKNVLKRRIEMIEEGIL